MWKKKLLLYRFLGKFSFGGAGRYIVLRTKRRIAESFVNRLKKLFEQCSHEPPIIRKVVLTSSCPDEQSAPSGTLLAQEEGFAPLAARPAPPLSMASFAV